MIMEVGFLKYSVELCKITERKQLNNTTFDYTVSAPKISQIAACGQFANILAEGKFLRRPISICEIDKQAGALRFVFEVRGEGTKLISQKLIGEYLDIFAPLGNGFTPLKNAEKAVVVGGGIGVPPLLQTAKEYGGKAVAILGFANSERIILKEDFEAVCEKTVVATDDGSYGHHGFVTDPLSQLLADEKVDIIHACGPMPMLRNVSKIAAQHGVPCLVSLEERMGCGMGACLVCACKIKTADGTTYKHVCKDGPVFDSREVEF